MSNLKYDRGKYGWTGPIKTGSRDVRTDDVLSEKEGWDIEPVVETEEDW